MSFPTGIHEECGVFGVFGVRNAATVAYYGLHSLQHRGQEACGIISVDADGNLLKVKEQGLVTDVFNPSNLATLAGDSAIGHVRYSTAGGGGIENVQPFLFRQEDSRFALAHNGNIINSAQLRGYLEDRGSLFQSTSDSEILAHLIRRNRAVGPESELSAILNALNMIEGAFSFLILTPERLHVCRDKYGLRPLSLGRLGDGYVVSSETCAFEITGAEFIRDIEPGEVLTIDAQGLHGTRYSEYRRHAMCAMEYIYFARPDSDIEGGNVHAFRKTSGKILWREAPAEADMVIGVPDSSLSAAMGYAEASGIPFEMGLVKSKYVGRTFIEPSQALRDRGVRLKLSTVRSIVEGKRIVLIDDSIVRGTTSRKIVRLLKEAGAREVHVRIASPMLRYPCFYGVDISTRRELLCARMGLEEACKAIEADSLAFLSEEALLEAGCRKDLCRSCFSGDYVTALYSHQQEIEN